MLCPIIRDPPHCWGRAGLHRRACAVPRRARQTSHQRSVTTLSPGPIVGTQSHLYVRPFDATDVTSHE